MNFVKCIRYKTTILDANRPETITDYNMSKLKISWDLHRISFGVEHGNEEFRKKILDRRWKNKDIIEKLKIPKKYEIQFSTNNITGFQQKQKNLLLILLN
jgi:anaerobic magnesium-protoporphyrin IX monomethyl ester cyclase